jgi:hypothetical protein
LNIWKFGGIILKETELLGGNPVLVSLSIINTTWISLEKNPDLSGERPTANRLKNGLNNFQKK